MESTVIGYTEVDRGRSRDLVRREGIEYAISSTNQLNLRNKNDRNLKGMLDYEEKSNATEYEGGIK